jgi:hypothetical protein
MNIDHKIVSSYPWYATQRQDTYGDPSFSIIGHDDDDFSYVNLIVSKGSPTYGNPQSQRANVTFTIEDIKRLRDYLNVRFPVPVERPAPKPVTEVDFESFSETPQLDMTTVQNQLECVYQELDSLVAVEDNQQDQIDCLAAALSHIVKSQEIAGTILKLQQNKLTELQEKVDSK